MKLYVASSWRNEKQPCVVQHLRGLGHEVYDFRNPTHDGVEAEPGRWGKGFHWSAIDADWQSWTPEAFRRHLEHPLAVDGFDGDFSAMKWADAGVLVLPCGRSAHLEAGYFKGAGKPLVGLLADGEPELMYRMFDHLCVDLGELGNALELVGMMQ